MNRRFRIGRVLPLLLVAGAVLTACGDRGGPRISVYKPGNATAKPAAPPQSTTRPVADVQDDGFHTVRAGETLYAISRAYKVGTRDLISLNGLQPPFSLQRGQRLRIPAARTHTVQAGETVYGISRQYGVDMSQLVRRNRIRPPFTIRVGQRLEIPGRVVEAQSIAARPVSAPPPPPAALSDAERQSLAGEPLDAPSTPVAAPAQAPAVATQPPVPSGPRAPRRGGVQNRPAETRVVQAFRVTEHGDPRPLRRPPGLARPRLATVDIPKPVARSGDSFLWPVQGRVISRFGPKAGGLHNDGLNIAAPRGTPIRAAENGVVVYAGSELQGFGNMVLLKHADGYVTAYAHAADVLVRRGDKVRRGQAIARVGSSGNVDRPQLHFEIRKGRRAINPKARLAG